MTFNENDAILWKRGIKVLQAHFHGTVLLGHIRKASGEIKK